MSRLRRSAVLGCALAFIALGTAPVSAQRNADPPPITFVVTPLELSFPSPRPQPRTVDAIPVTFTATALELTFPDTAKSRGTRPDPTPVTFTATTLELVFPSPTPVKK